MKTNNADYWQDRYLENKTGWDLGQVSPPLKAYFEQLKDKSLKILIPGSGNAYEAEYLHFLGFNNVYVVDWAQQAIENIKKRIPEFPRNRLLSADFFELDMQFDLIIEQTFFCALNPSLRKAYVSKMHSLLKPEGKLVGLLFQIPLNQDMPPFGGCKEEYLELFNKEFELVQMETAYNSISPRHNNELFVIMKKRFLTTDN
ncbi:MAG: methyltransferase domain-containing protein [Chitinophagales bacterium]|nr:methyltransferase domain-containing protein [Chitinophagales bacterium]